MKQSKKLEKSRGVVILATNTETTDYIKIAKKAAKLAKKNLKLPVTIISNHSVDAGAKNKRYSMDSGQFESWNNLNRYRAYELSPYDQTILIDSDYLIFDNSLLKLLDTVQDYFLHNQNIFIENPSQQEKLGKYGLNSVWATVIVFNKTDKSRLLFELVKRIQNNYGYYTKLYNIPSTNYRNDYAFTIADSIINGYKQDSNNYIPWPLVTIINPIVDFTIKQDCFFIKERNIAFVLPRQNIHILSKKFLEEKNFDES